MIGKKANLGFAAALFSVIFLVATVMLITLPDATIKGESK